MSTGHGPLVLGAEDLLPSTPRRVLVVGTSGSGKTTLAARIAPRLGLEHVEIDALFHGPDWQPRPTFVEDVRAFAERDGWITEWQYSSHLGDLLQRCTDLVVWLDLPTAVVMRQVTVRTLRRRLLRQQLWNGNVEGPLREVLTDPDHIIRWAWRTRRNPARRIEGLHAVRPEVPVVRLRSRREVRRWVESLPQPGPPPAGPSAATREPGGRATEDG